MARTMSLYVLKSASDTESGWDDQVEEGSVPGQVVHRGSTVAASKHKGQHHITSHHIIYKTLGH